MTDILFPKEFTWGTGTSAYQVEGAANIGGKGESIWDRFTRKNGRNTDKSCNHYQLFRDDISLMRYLKFNAYRFSISWSRIFPNGYGKLNQEGIDFYSKLVDELISQGITPFITLYHWDLPQALEDKGGWKNRDTAKWYGDYAAAVSNALGDRVNMWSTFNDPGIFSLMGYVLGLHAPGEKDPSCFFNVSHNINIAHGTGVSAIRSEAENPKIGISLQITPVFPKTDEKKDYEAADITDAFINRWWAGPVLAGKYPEDLLDKLSNNFIYDENDLQKIFQPLDFVGLNTYTRIFAYYDKKVPFFQSSIDTAYQHPGSRYTDMGWEVYPEAVYESLMRIKDEWGHPDIYITENGSAEKDIILDGRIKDTGRINYFKSYLSEVKRAMDAGVNVKGYFLWSFLDGFEWAEGTTKRFGIVHVDYETLRRTPKDSALWFRNMMGEGGFNR